MNTTNKLINQLKIISSDDLVIHLLGNPVTSIIAEAADRLEELSQSKRESVTLGQQRKPLSNEQIKQMQERHFTPEYPMRTSDEVCLNWYRLGIRDCEKAHYGIGSMSDIKLTITLPDGTNREIQPYDQPMVDEALLMRVVEITKQNETLKRDYDVMKALYETDLEGRDKAISELLDFAEEVRQTGVTRLARFAIALIVGTKRWMHE